MFVCLLAISATGPATEEFKCLLRERLQEYDDSRIIGQGHVTSVDQLLSQLEGTELVVATRFHNVLLALLNNKPVVAISFHHKVTSLMNAMGLSNYCLDINDFKGEELIAKFGDVRRNVGALKSVIKERAEDCRKQLDEQYGLIFKDLLPGLEISPSKQLQDGLLNSPAANKCD